MGTYCHRVNSIIELMRKKTAISNSKKYKKQAAKELLYSCHLHHLGLLHVLL